MSTLIQKRDGRVVEFDRGRVVNAIMKAMKSCDRVDAVLAGTIGDDVACKVACSEYCTVEDIQNDIEHQLMKFHAYAAAKAFMLYRKQHEDDRETAEKLKFIVDYCKSSNAATGSKFDANANVEHKNIATLIGELPKQGFIRLNRRLLCDRIKEMYGKELADKYLDLLNHHFIYKNDETSLANYCASITMYPWLNGGTKSIGGNSTPPTNLKSFCGGFVNMVFIVSSMLSGACATPEFLMYMSYFLGKEFGSDYYKRANEQADMSLKKRTIDKVITDCFEQVVYSLNQPTGARNFQPVFWNISYYDKFYFESIFGHFRFPDDSKPDWDALNWLQKRFMNWFNEERTKTVLTFPVETMALLTENGDAKDKEYGDFTAEMYSKGHSFFTYMSDNADSLASCCFSKDTEVLWKYKFGGEKTGTFEDLYAQFIRKGANFVYTLDSDGNFAKAKPIKLPNRQMYTITFENGEEIVVSDNHINCTTKGEKVTTEVEVGDIFEDVDGNNNFIVKGISKSDYKDAIYCFEMLDESHPYFSFPNGLKTHNCRLRNAIQDNGFSYTLGAGGVSTGSKSVLTININRCVQQAKKEGKSYVEYLEPIVDLVHKVQMAYNENLKALQDKGMLPLFDAGYINIKRQYLTVGVNGIVEAAESLGISISDNKEYESFVADILGLIEEYNKKYRSKDLLFNCEMIPAENVGVKHAKWDREDGYMVPRDCYNSYFYVVEDPNTNIIEKFRLHGRKYIEHLTGGSALHMNLEEHLSQPQYRQLLRVAAQEGCNYFTFNIPNTYCNDCGHIDKRYLKECPHCHSKNVDYLTRIIGYLKRVSSFSADRQKEAARRFYAKGECDD